MKMDLYKLELEGGNTGNRTLVETIEAADAGDIRIAAMKKHAGGVTSDDQEYFKAYFRLFEHGEQVQTEAVKFSRELVEKMLSLERADMSKAERQALN